MRIINNNGLKLARTRARLAHRGALVPLQLPAPAEADALRPQTDPQEQEILGDGAVQHPHCGVRQHPAELHRQLHPGRNACVVLVPATAVPEPVCAVRILPGYAYTKSGFTGICQDSSNLKLYFITQPIAIVLEAVISIVNFFGFNSFLRATNLFQQEKNFSAVLAIMVSVIFLVIALFSTFILVRMVRERRELTASMM